MVPTFDGMGLDPDFFPFEYEGEEFAHNPLDIPFLMP